ncbi:MAG: Oxidoreductase family, NAD-binding Rossmann fold [Acidobacteriaceae bacterium]|nr:Oxidoreductase family, NAD-binding Rossmann fold [Acidobacteriaceae bacterium]
MAKANAPAYLIVGRGRWGSRMHAMLAGEGRRAEFASGLRRKTGESSGAHESRLAQTFSDSSAQIVWLCVPPGAHLPVLIRAAFAAGLHVIVEKPWVYSREETTLLQDAAAKAGLKGGVHFEYCLLSEIENWRRQHKHESGLAFGGVFNVHAGDRLGIPPMQNLGSHLLAMREYAVPHSHFSEIRCGYELPDQRTAWLESDNQRVASIDFLDCKEPIVQRFLAHFENSLEGQPFPFDFAFAQRVNERLR